MSRDKLIGYLWPDRDTEHARNLLKTAVHELRKTLGEDVIRSTGDQLSLNTSLLTCDVVDFEAAVAAKDYEKAAALYRGPFLDGFFLKGAHEFELWVDAQRAKLATMRGRVSRELAVPRTSVASPPVTAMPAVQTTSSVVSSPVTPLARNARRMPWMPFAMGVFVVAVISAVFVAVKQRRDTAFALLANEGNAGVVLPDDSVGSALEFNGRDANVSTQLGAVVTSQLDNIVVDMMVRYEAPTPKPPMVIYYNGHGAVTGWGLIVLGRADAQPDGTVGLLAGGIAITATPLVLKPGVWQHLTAERREGRVTVWLDDKSYSVGLYPVNPVQGKERDRERTSIGGSGTFDQAAQPFRGAIDRVQLRDLASGYFIDRWNFDEGAGATTMGAKGHELFVGKAAWIAGERRSARDIFWDRLNVLCGHSYRGTLTDGSAADSVFRRDALILHVARCTPTEVRMALHVGVDRSRSLVIARTATGLALTHEVHGADGAESKMSGFGGETRDQGAIGRQEFPANARAE
ncbi:MAG TPA: hypothetical protein VF483_09755, partial [Gemmatimonadaceae bacterium]